MGLFLEPEVLLTNNQISVNWKLTLVTSSLPPLDKIEDLSMAS